MTPLRRGADELRRRLEAVRDVLRRVLTHPARIVPLVYALGWLLGTVLLRLPVSSGAGQQQGWWESAFTAMSALCITGLAVVDTAAGWSHAGQGVILGLVQVGGFGIMTLTSLVLFRVLGASSHLAALMAQAETRSGHRGISRIPVRILVMSLATEGVLTVLLTLRYLVLGLAPGSALYHGFFHAVSAFNNAGFSLYDDGLTRFNTDPWIMVPICAGIVVGGLGFPVFLELLDHVRGTAVRRLWSVHTHLTVRGTLLLLVIGYVTFALFEWTNPSTLGDQPWSGRLLGALGGTVFPRTVGFNSIDYSLASEPTILVTSGLMMIGGGSAGTAGGIKIATAAVLLVNVLSEVSGEPDSIIARRRLSFSVTRQALAVTVLAFGSVLGAVLIMSTVESATLEALGFEAVSAFSNTGLSMNLTPHLSHESWAVLMGLMFLGRVGPVSAVAALTLRARNRLFTYPQEDPLVG